MRKLFSRVLACARLAEPGVGVLLPLFLFCRKDTPPVRVVGLGLSIWPRLSSCLLLIGLAGIALAQPATTPPSTAMPEVPPKAAAPVEPAVPQPTAPLGPPAPASELDTYFLRDSKGNLVPVIGMSFEDYEKLTRLQKGLAPPPPPAYSIDSWTLTGKADSGTADLQATVQVRVRQDGWVRVPLRLGGAALLEPARYQGAGEHVLSSAGESEGYWLWLKGQGKPHQLQLKLAVPISDVGLERRLQLSLPRGTESAIRLQVPLPFVAAHLRNGSEGILSTKSLSDKQSEISVVGPTGDLQLAWTAGRAAPPESKLTLIAFGDIFVRVESRSRISAEARLKLRADGKPLETVSIRLPPGMSLVPAPTTGYTVTLTETDASKPGAGRVVDVRFDRPTTGPVEVRLLTEQEVSATATDTAVRPARFEVIGAQRQRGNIDFLVEGDWNLTWSDESFTKRVELTETPLAAGRPVARFEYYKQPLDLKLSVTPRPTRVAVEPQYTVFVDASRLRLEAAFRFRIRGPKATAANVDLAGWRIDSITGENSAEQPLPPADGATQLALPLGQMDPTKGELTYRIEAHQDLPAEQETIRFGLPRPQVDITSPSAIAVQPADNVELSPTASELKGLVADNAVTTTSPAARQQPQLLYRDLGASEAIQFIGVRRVRARHTSARGQVSVKLRSGPIEIEQRLHYQIAYEGKRSYLLALPPGFAEPAGLQVLHGDQLLEHRALPAEDEGPLTLEVFDTQSRLGPVELTLQYSLPAPSWKGDAPVDLQFPLITPVVADFDRWLGQGVRIEYPDDLHLQLPKSSGLGEELIPSGRGVLEGKSAQLLTTVKVEASLLQTPEVRGLVIDRLWLQSWLAPTQRQERCVIQLRTAAAGMVVRLPETLSKSNVRILVDGQSRPHTATGERSVRIEFAAAATTTESQSHVVELWYSAPRVAAGWWLAENRLLPPQVEGADPPQSMQWQVILPAQEHLLFDPRDYAPEMKWNWQKFYWSRTAIYDQLQLEKWCNGSKQEPFPSSLNSYLFSTVGSEPALQVTTMGQRSLAIWLAGGGLLLGLLILHVPQVRSSTGLLFLAAAFLAAGFAAPQTMLFVGQVFGMGLVIVAITAAVRWLWTGQVPATTTAVSRAPSQLSGPRSTGSRSSPPVTTAAANAIPAASVSPSTNPPSLNPSPVSPPPGKQEVES